VLLTSHDLVDVERLADRIAILDRGRVVALGTPDELTGAGSAALRFRLAAALADPDVAALAERLGGVVAPDGGPGRYRLVGPAPDPAVVAALAAWCAERAVRIVELRAGSLTLEERYLELTGATASGDPA